MMIYINENMIQRISKTFHCDGSIGIGKKQINYNTQDLEVEIEYMWVADVLDILNYRYGLVALKTKRGLFGTYVVPQYHLQNDETLFNVIKHESSGDPLYNVLANTTLFPTIFHLDWGSGTNCSLYILTQAMSTKIYFSSGSKQDPMIERIWQALKAYNSQLFQTYTAEEQIFIQKNLLQKYQY